MQARARKILLYVVAAPAFFFTVFLLAAYWTFPYDRLRDYIVQQVEQPMGPDGTRHPSAYHLEIEELSPSWLTGVELSGVHFSRQAEEVAAAAPSPEPSTASPNAPTEETGVTTIDEITVRVSLLSLLAGSTSLSFSASIGDGHLEGKFQQSEERTHVVLHAEQVPLDRIGAIEGALGLPMRGSVNGDIDIEVAKDPKETAGNADLSIEGLAIGDGKAKLKLAGMTGGFTLDRINAGTMKIQAAVEEGALRLKDVSAKGPDIELHATGSVRLLHPINNSRVDVTTRIAFADAYKNKSERTQSLFSLMELSPALRSARTPDGALQYRVTGALSGRLSAVAAGRTTMPGSRTMLGAKPHASDEPE